MDLEKCVPLLNSAWQTAGPRPPARTIPRPVVTISRQSGCGARAVGERLASYLETRQWDSSCPWKVVDSNLVAKVLAEHRLPRRYAKFMPEDRVSELADTMDELLGAHPPSAVLARHTGATILRLASRGNVILIGRGANLITHDLEHAVHVRLVASLEQRLERFRQFRDVTRADALELIRREDRGRRRYLKQHFGAEVDDPLGYHLVINTSLIPCEKAARLIGDVVLSCVCLKRNDRSG